MSVYRGQTPAQAESNYLNKVKWLEMYGVDMHVVMVTSSCPIFAVAMLRITVQLNLLLSLKLVELINQSIEIN